MRVRYYRMAASDILLTAVYDGSSWSLQGTFPASELTEKAVSAQIRQQGYAPYVERRPVYYVPGKTVGVGTSGQRTLFKKKTLRLEYWDGSSKNGLFANSLLLWGKTHLGELLTEWRKLFNEKIEEVKEERTSRYPFSQLPVHFVRERHWTRRGELSLLEKRIRGIASHGLSAWNVRLALYRMQGQGQPIGDQVSADCLTGGWRYIFFYGDLFVATAFKGESTLVLPQANVLRRPSARWYSGDSGISQSKGLLQSSCKTSELLGEVQWPSQAQQEYLVLGHIPASELVILTSNQLVNDMAAQLGMECHCVAGPIDRAYERLSRQILAAA